LDEARQTDLNITKVLLPERCTQDKNVYEISYNNNRWGSKIYGILSVPVKKGKYPALLRVPGAGVRPYAGDTYTAPSKCIVLEIGIHGIPVTMEQKVYDDLLNGELNGYWDTNLENPDRNSYKRVITGAVRGVDFIAALPEWDGKTIGVTGGIEQLPCFLREQSHTLYPVCKSQSGGYLAVGTWRESLGFFFGRGDSDDRVRGKHRSLF
jgi:cephalosporin-C deacetylase